MFSIIRADELKAMIDRNDEFALLDVLPSEFFMKQQLPGAINIPLHDENFEIMVEKMIPNKSMPVVIYSANSDCEASSKACEQLAKIGYKNVIDYENGIDEWIALGYSLDK